MLCIMKALLGRPIWMFLAWRRKSRFNIAIKMWWTTQILIYTHWSSSSRIQRDFRRIPDIWVQWKIISLNQGGAGDERRKYTSSHPNHRRGKKAQTSKAIFNSGPFDMNIKKEHEDFTSICGGLKTWRCFIGLCETRNCSLKTPLNCRTALFSHTVAALVQSVIYSNSSLFMHLSVQCYLEWFRFFSAV